MQFFFVIITVGVAIVVEHFISHRCCSCNCTEQFHAIIVVITDHRLKLLLFVCEQSFVTGIVIIHYHCAKNLQLF